jgi:hypothetical protein
VSVFDDYSDPAADPDYAEMWLDFADMLRKREKEQAADDAEKNRLEFRCKDPEGDWINDQGEVEGHSKP